MDERRKKAFDFASELTKQLITLSTGILAITITFSRDIIKSPVTPRTAIVMMMLAWGVYLLCIVFGIWTLMALTGELEPKPGTTASPPEPTTKNFNVFLPTLLQIVSFLIATMTVIVFGVISVW